MTANFPTGTRTRLPQRLVAVGYIVDVPDTQSASVKWQHGDLQADVLIEYSDQNLSHAKVAQVLVDVVASWTLDLAPNDRR